MYIQDRLSQMKWSQRNRLSSDLVDLNPGKITGCSPPTPAGNGHIKDRQYDNKKSKELSEKCILRFRKDFSKKFSGNKFFPNNAFSCFAGARFGLQFG